MRQGRAKYIFPGNNTPKGFISHYQDGIQGMEQVFILKGGPGVGKSTLMRKIGIAMLERGYDVEFWQCSSDNDSLDGVLMPAISTAIIDGTPPHNMDPKYPGAVEEIVDLGANWNRALLKGSKKEIITLTDNIGAHFEQCYAKLAQAGKILETQKKEKSSLLDLSAISQKSRELAKSVFNPGKSSARHLFSTAITPRGTISFTESLFKLASHRWILFGSFGCGKELLLSQLTTEAEQRGHYAEIYHPALLPDQIELLLLPNLDTAILDGGDTPPAYATSEDYLIDCTAFSQTNEANDSTAINALVDEATEKIAEAKDLHDKLEKHYTRTMDFDKVDIAGEALFNRILTLCAEKESGHF